MRRRFIHLIIIIAVALLAYSNTFHVPLLWDAKELIAENPVIKDLNYFLHPSRAEGQQEYGIFKRRYISFLTFALNYRIHGLDVEGYHIFNVAIHIINALLVYTLVILTFRTPYLSGSRLKGRSEWIALLSGLLFVSHPVQTEAVTYVMQRFASLAAFFYLLSMVSYIGWRLAASSRSWGRSWGLYLLCLVFALLAMKTKENSLTLPFAIALYEVFFFKGARKARALPIVPLFLVLAVIPLSMVETGMPVGQVLFGAGPEVGEYTRESAFDKDYLYPSISRWEYLNTQIRVVCTYIRLLVLPINQNLDRYYPLYPSFFDLPVVLSFLFLSGIFGLGVYLFYRSRVTDNALRIVTFGIFWFFLTLSVESSIIPIPMIIAEYRLYLPSVGIIIAVLTGGSLLAEKTSCKKAGTVLVALVFLLALVLSAATYARNNVWKSGISLWEDVVRKSPRNARGQNALGHAYLTNDMADRAIEHFQIAIKLIPNYAEVHDNLGLAYNEIGMTGKAREHLRIAMRLRPDYKNAVFERTIEYYKSIIKLDPGNVDAYNDLGVTYFSMGMADEALGYYETALRLNPDYGNAHFNMGEAYFSKGLVDKAIEHYRVFLGYRPDYAEAHYNLGLAYEDRGLAGKAVEHYRRALALDPDHEEAQENLEKITGD